MLPPLGAPSSLPLEDYFSSCIGRVSARLSFWVETVSFVPLSWCLDSYEWDMSWPLMYALKWMSFHGLKGNRSLAFPSSFSGFWTAVFFLWGMGLPSKNVILALIRVFLCLVSVAWSCLSKVLDHHVCYFVVGRNLVGKGIGATLWRSLLLWIYGNLEGTFRSSKVAFSQQGLVYVLLPSLSCMVFPR